MKNFSTQAQTAIGPRDLQARLAQGGNIQLIDVRTPGEFAAGHVPGARLFPLGDINPVAFQGLGPLQGPVYVICQSGRRAQQAIAKLQAAGIDNCVLVEGGTQAWIEAGLPVERRPGEGLPLMRQVQIIVGLLSALGAVLALMVNSLFALIPLVMGCGLFFAGVTGTCGLALVLAKMPWNRSKECCAACNANSRGMA